MRGPFSACIRCAFLFWLVLSTIIYVTGWSPSEFHKTDSLFMAFGFGFALTMHLSVGAAALWVFSGFFK